MLSLFRVGLAECCRVLASLSPSMLLVLLQLPQLPLLARTLPDELPDELSEPDSHCGRRSGHFLLGRARLTPFCLKGPSRLGAAFGVSGFMLEQ